MCKFVSEDGDVVEAAALVALRAAEDDNFDASLRADAAVARLPGLVRKDASVGANAIALVEERVVLRKHVERSINILIASTVEVSKASQAFRLKAKRFLLVDHSRLDVPFELSITSDWRNADGCVVPAVPVVVVDVIHEGPPEG
jgi:hypothetical protein